MVLLLAAAFWPGSVLAKNADAPPQEEGVYQISTAEELEWFAGLVNGTLEDTQSEPAASAALLCDIDLGGDEWTPVGMDYSHQFKGTFDGQGCTISGLT